MGCESRNIALSVSIVQLRKNRLVSVALHFLVSADYLLLKIWKFKEREWEELNISSNISVDRQ